MNAIVIASIVIVGTLLLGALIAVIVRGFSRAVDKENASFVAEKASYQPAVTLGHDIPVDAKYEDQLQEARKVAARQAAYLPRGANVGIGQYGGVQQQTSFDGIQADPISAVRMAQFHGWQGLKTGTQTAPVATPVAVKGVAEAVAPDKSSGNLVAGIDYPFTEISEEMTPAEKRKARIANAKAKSAATKKAKMANAAAVAPKALPADSTSAPSPAPATVMESLEPVPGIDYEVIAITDDMPPDEIRKARIANAKAKSAANKQFKAAGGTISASAPPAQAEAIDQASPPPAGKVATESSPEVSIPIGIPAPNYIDITDGMASDEIRKARINNAKEKSAYNKALRAAGIDPKSIT